jgi:hypothetical protein
VNLNAFCRRFATAPARIWGSTWTAIVREDPRALRGVVGHRALAKPRVLRDGLGDGVVQAAVERMKLVHGDRRVEVVGQLRDDLADVAVVVNHLRDGVAATQERGAVRHGRGAGSCGRLDLGRRGAERFDEFIQEERHAALELVFGRLRSESLNDPRSRERNDFVSVGGDEFGEQEQATSVKVSTTGRAQGRRGRRPIGVAGGSRAARARLPGEGRDGHDERPSLDGLR